MKGRPQRPAVGRMAVLGYGLVSCVLATFLALRLMRLFPVHFWLLRG